jgi:hypothetical protein
MFVLRTPTDEDSEPSLHFMVVLLARMEQVTLINPEMRRQVLETSISCRPGYAIIADRSPISSGCPSQREATLREIFGHIADHKGLVLNASDSIYNDWNLPWVKACSIIIETFRHKFRLISRSAIIYIPGYGDTADLIAFGACWDKDRGREVSCISFFPRKSRTYHMKGSEVFAMQCFDSLF